MPRHIQLIAIAACFAFAAQACVFGFDTSYDAPGAGDESSEVDSADVSDAVDTDTGDLPEATDTSDTGDLPEADAEDTTDADLDATDADAETDTCVENGCGGCTALPTLGAPCGPCDLDELECEGTNAVACDGATACSEFARGATCDSDAQ